MQVVRKRLIFLKMGSKCCAVCGKEFSPTNNRAKYCEYCRLCIKKDRKKAYRQSEKGKSYHKAYYKAWIQSEKGKISDKAYRNSEKGKAVRKAYFKSEKGKAVIKSYRQSEKGKAVRKAYFKTYQQSDKYKSIIKSYRQSEKGKATSKVSNQKKILNMKSYYLNQLGIPPELHDLKRAQLQLLRACRE